MDLHRLAYHAAIASRLSSEPAIELRQSSPFAGALSPKERWRIVRETRERFEGAA